MSSKKGRSRPKKKNPEHHRRHRRKNNLDKMWEPKNPTLRKKKLSFKPRGSGFHIPQESLDYFIVNSTYKVSTSYTSFPNQPYNNQG